MTALAHLLHNHEQVINIDHFVTLGQRGNIQKQRHGR